MLETIGDLKNISSHPTAEEVARADRLEETKSLPEDQLHLDPQVIGRITIGLRTLDNKGVPQDYKEAVKWFRLAAEQGLAEAQYNLGNRYHNGQGVPQAF